MEKAGEVGEGLKDAGKTVVDKIVHPIETTKGECDIVVVIYLCLI